MSIEIGQLIGEAFQYPIDNDAYKRYVDGLCTNLAKNGFDSKIVGSRTPRHDKDVGLYSVATSDIDFQVIPRAIDRDDWFERESLASLIHIENFKIQNPRWRQNKLCFLMAPEGPKDFPWIAVEIVVLATWTERKYIEIPPVRALYPNLMSGVPPLYGESAVFYGVPKCKSWDVDKVYTHPVKVTTYLRELQSDLHPTALFGSHVMRVISEVDSRAACSNGLKLLGIGMLIFTKGFSLAKKTIIHPHEILNVTINTARVCLSGGDMQKHKRGRKEQFEWKVLRYLDMLSEDQIRRFMGNLYRFGEVLFQCGIGQISHHYYSITVDRSWHVVYLLHVVGAFKLRQNKSIHDVRELLNVESWGDIFDIVPMVRKDTLSIGNSLITETWHIESYSLKQMLHLWYESSRTGCVAHSQNWFKKNVLFLIYHLFGYDLQAKRLQKVHPGLWDLLPVDAYAKRLEITDRVVIEKEVHDSEIDVGLGGATIEHQSLEVEFGMELHASKGDNEVGEDTTEYQGLVRRRKVVWDSEGSEDSS